MQPKIMQVIRKKREDSWIVDAHHIMMCVYGWIPMSEFKEMKIPTFLNLLKHAIKEYEVRHIVILGKKKK